MSIQICRCLRKSPACIVVVTPGRRSFSTAYSAYAKECIDASGLVGEVDIVENGTTSALTALWVTGSAKASMPS